MSPPALPPSFNEGRKIVPPILPPDAPLLLHVPPRHFLSRGVRGQRGASLASGRLTGLPPLAISAPPGCVGRLLKVREKNRRIG